MSLIIAVSIVLLHSTAAYANLAEEQKKLEQVQQEQQRRESQLKEVQQQKNNLIKELERLNNQLNEAENQLGQVERDIEATRKELERVTKELEEAQKELEKRDDLYKQRLRAMYKNSGYATGSAAKCRTAGFRFAFLSGARWQPMIFQYLKN